MVAASVFVDAKLPPGEAGNQLTFLISNGDRHFDEINRDMDEKGSCLAGFRHLGSFLLEGIRGLRRCLGLARSLAGGCLAWRRTLIATL